MLLRKNTRSASREQASQRSVSCSRREHAPWAPSAALLLALEGRCTIHGNERLVPATRRLSCPAEATPQLATGSAPLSLRFALGGSSRGSTGRLRSRLERAVRRQATRARAMQATHRRSHFVDERLPPYPAGFRRRLGASLLRLRPLRRRCVARVAARSRNARDGADSLRSREPRPSRCAISVPGCCAPLPAA